MDELKDSLNNARFIEFDNLMSDVRYEFDSNVSPKDEKQVIFDNLIKDLKLKVENNKGGPKKSKNEIMNEFANDSNIMMQIKNIDDLIKK